MVPFRESCQRVRFASQSVAVFLTVPTVNEGCSLERFLGSYYCDWDGRIAIAEVWSESTLRIENALEAT